MIEENIHTKFQYLFGEGSVDYLLAFNKYVSKFNEVKEKVKLAFDICICSLLLVIYGLMFKADRCERCSEYHCINLISTINMANIFVNSIKEFLRRAVGSTSDKEDTLQTPRLTNNFYSDGPGAAN
jgi:hypothetical protein